MRAKHAFNRRVIAGSLIVLGLLAGISPVLAQTEAQKFTPPPRSIADITAILDQEKPHPERVAAQKQVVESQAPAGISGVEAIEFYTKRGSAADELGRQKQAMADLQLALDAARAIKDQPPSSGMIDGGGSVYARALGNLARVKRRGGDTRGAIELQQ